MTATKPIEIPQPTPEADAILLARLVSQEASKEVCFETLVGYAASRKATDLFCASTREGYDIFMRCEGKLFTFGEVDKDWGDHLLNYIKVQADIPLSDRHPHDARLFVQDGDSPIDLRVSFMPTYFGEELAVRILDRRVRLVHLNELGMLPQQLKRTQKLIHERSGLVLVTGKTGSGKTTTLYAILNELNDGSHKINTLEDPVECHILGIHQSQVDAKHGHGFADLLKALLRHSPDVVMVGEIRDAETAEVAVQAALAGQAVFATLHAPSAADAVYSLLQLGVNPHVLAGALRGVIAQDMLRCPCEGCSTPIDPAEVSLPLDEVMVHLENESTPSPVSSQGCEKCSNSGHQGLTCIFEVLEVTPTIGELIRNGNPPSDLSQKAVEEGMITRRLAATIAVAKGKAHHEEACQIH